MLLHHISNHALSHKSKWHCQEWDLMLLSTTLLRGVSKQVNNGLHNVAYHLLKDEQT